VLSFEFDLRSFSIAFLLNREELKACPLKSGMNLGCPLSPLVFKIVLEILDRAFNTREINGIQLEKEGKLSLLMGDMILYINDTKDFTKKLLYCINTFSRIAG
jgi:hypothetical protein